MSKKAYNMNGKKCKISQRSKFEMVKIFNRLNNAEKKKIYNCKVTSNVQISDKIMKIVIHAPEVSENAKPGQFVNVYPDGGVNILPRPISICDADVGRKTITLVYAIVGDGTRQLAAKKKADNVRISSPLGNGFTMPWNLREKDTIDSDDVRVAHFKKGKKYANSSIGGSSAAGDSIEDSSIGGSSAAGDNRRGRNIEIGNAEGDSIKDSRSESGNVVGESNGADNVMGKNVKVRNIKSSNNAKDSEDEGFITNEWHFGHSDNENAAIQNVVLIGGGVGIAPMIFLSRILAKEGVECTIVAGFKDEIFLEKEINAHASEVFLTTEEPRENAFMGNVVDCLEVNDIKGSIFYACGPYAMLKNVNRYVETIDGRIQVSLEERMGCGYGACVGCVCDVYETNLNGTKKIVKKKVCYDGPVFSGDEVIWK